MDPVTLALGIAALVGGTGFQVSARNQQRRAARTASNKFAAKSKQRSDEANAIFQKSLADQDATKQQEAIDAARDEKLTRVEDLFTREAANYDPLLPGQERAPTVVKEEGAKQLSDGLARARARLAAVAQLEGFGSRTFDRKLQLQDNASLLGNIGLFARGDRDVFDTDMFAAQQQGGNKALIGDLLVTLGQIGLTSGLSGGASSVVGRGAAGGTGAGMGTVQSASRMPVMLG